MSKLTHQSNETKNSSHPLALSKKVSRPLPAPPASSKILIMSPPRSPPPQLSETNPKNHQIVTSLIKLILPLGKIFSSCDHLQADTTSITRLLGALSRDANIHKIMNPQQSIEESLSNDKDVKLLVVRAFNAREKTSGTQNYDPVASFAERLLIVSGTTGLISWFQFIDCFSQEMEFNLMALQKQMESLQRTGQLSPSQVVTLDTIINNRIHAIGAACSSSTEQHPHELIRHELDDEAVVGATLLELAGTKDAKDVKNVKNENVTNNNNNNNNSNNSSNDNFAMDQLDLLFDRSSDIQQKSNTIFLTQKQQQQQKQLASEKQRDATLHLTAAMELPLPSSDAFVDNGESETAPMLNGRNQTHAHHHDHVHERGAGNAPDVKHAHSKVDDHQNAAMNDYVHERGAGNGSAYDAPDVKHAHSKVDDHQNATMMNATHAHRTPERRLQPDNNNVQEENNYYEEDPYVIDEVCEALSDRIDFHNDSVRDVILLIEILESNALEQDQTSSTDPSTASEKIVMVAGQINDIIGGNKMAKLIYHTWEDIFHHDDRRPQQKPRQDMKEFGSNGMKPGWTPVFNNHTHINAINFLAKSGTPKIGALQQHTRRNSFLHRLPPTLWSTSPSFQNSQRSTPSQSPWSAKSKAAFNPGGHGDGRNRRRSIHASEEKTAQRLHQGVTDKSSPRADGLHIHAKPRSTLRKNTAFLTSSRVSKKQDYYDGSWRVRNAQSSLYDTGVRGTTNDMGAQRKLQKQMQKHKTVMFKKWENGGSMF